MKVSCVDSSVSENFNWSKGLEDLLDVVKSIEMTQERGEAML